MIRDKEVFLLNHADAEKRVLVLKRECDTLMAARQIVYGVIRSDCLPRYAGEPLLDSLNQCVELLQSKVIAMDAIIKGGHEALEAHNAACQTAGELESQSETVAAYNTIPELPFSWLSETINQFPNMDPLVAEILFGTIAHQCKTIDEAKSSFESTVSQLAKEAEN